MFYYVNPPPSQFWQLFNALTLFNLARDPKCKEWQVSRSPWKGHWEGQTPASVLTLVPPSGGHVRLPLPPPLPWQFLHHPAGRAPEIPHSAAWQQERLRLDLPLPTGLEGASIPHVLFEGEGAPLVQEGLFCSPLVLWTVGPKGYAGEAWCPSLRDLGTSGLNKGREAQRWLQVCVVLRVRWGLGGSLCLPWHGFVGLLSYWSLWGL